MKNLKTASMALSLCAIATSASVHAAPDTLGAHLVLLETSIPSSGVPVIPSDAGPFAMDDWLLASSAIFNAVHTTEAFGKAITGVSTRANSIPVDDTNGEGSR